MTHFFHWQTYFILLKSQSFTKKYLLVHAFQFFVSDRTGGFHLVQFFKQSLALPITEDARRRCIHLVAAVHKIFQVCFVIWYPIQIQFCLLSRIFRNARKILQGGRLLKILRLLRFLSRMQAWHWVKTGNWAFWVQRLEVINKVTCTARIFITTLFKASLWRHIMVWQSKGLTHF